MENGKLKMETEKWKMKKLRVENEEWRVEKGK